MPDLPDAERPQPGSTELIEGEDYYYEGAYLVFTAKYLLRRGTCCNSGCRHCPYKEKRPEPLTSG